MIYYDRERLIVLFKQHALQFGTFKLSNGGTSTYYVDGRQITLSSAGARQVAAGVWEQLCFYHQVVAIGGPVIGADPIVAATLMVSDRNLKGFLVRTAAKDHGTTKLVEGPVNRGDAVAIVDDTATSGNSLLRATDAMIEMGCRVTCIIVVLDRLEGAAELIAARGIPFHPLLTIRDLGIK